MSSTLPVDVFDEVFEHDGQPRAHAQALVAELERLGADSLVAAGTLRDTIFMRQGITCVCQDFVHLALILLRRRGIAARYVSGYLFASPPDGGFDSVEVDTHAWLEVLLPDGGERGEPVWVGVDPTNRARAGEQYVKIGHGRRYDDVPPIKGVYRGGAPAELSASVVMTRLDPATSARA